MHVVLPVCLLACLHACMQTYTRTYIHAYRLLHAVRKHARESLEAVTRVCLRPPGTAHNQGKEQTDKDQEVGSAEVNTPIFLPAMSGMSSGHSIYVNVQKQLMIQNLPWLRTERRGSKE